MSNLDIYPTRNDCYSSFLCLTLSLNLICLVVLSLFGYEKHFDFKRIYSVRPDHSGFLQGISSRTSEGGKTGCWISKSYHWWKRKVRRCLETSFHSQRSALGTSRFRNSFKLELWLSLRFIYQLQSRLSHSLAERLEVNCFFLIDMLDLIRISSAFLLVKRRTPLNMLQRITRLRFCVWSCTAAIQLESPWMSFISVWWSFFSSAHSAVSKVWNVFFLGFRRHSQRIWLSFCREFRINR